MRREKTLEDNLYVLGIFFLGISVVAGALIYYVLLPRFSFPDCVLNAYFGLYCPGCGGTRALVSLLHGHLLQSLWYHPLVPYSALIFGAFMLSQTLARLTRYRYFRGLSFHSWYLYVAIVIVVINWILKNILLLVWKISL